MAASTAEKDYFHQVLAYLKGRGYDVNFAVINFAIWETQSHDRSEAFDILDPYLNERIHMITLQLGENVSNFDTFEPDFRELIKHIKEKCPAAQVLVIGDFWEKGRRDLVKQKAAKDLGVGFIDLSPIKEKKEYQAGLGAVVFDDDGNPHTIEHKGVAAHPGDRGMRYIAEKLIEHLQF